MSSAGKGVQKGVIEHNVAARAKDPPSQLSNKSFICKEVVRVSRFILRAGCVRY
jgi:hypothetical protein